MMKLGRELHTDIYNSGLEDMSNELHCDKLEFINTSCELYCDELLYDIVEDTIQQFNSTELNKIILYL